MGGDKAQAPDDPPRRSDLGSTLVLATILLTLAAWAMPRAVQAGDAGEFATIMLTGGVPHPPGYPWMRALGLLSRGLWAIGVPPIIAAALPPTLAGVAAWLILQRTTAASLAPLLGSRRAGALAASVVLLAAASPLVLLHVGDSEVWGPHLLFSALFLRACLQPARPPSRGETVRRPLALGLWLGLAVSHHLTAVLLVPLAVAGAWPRRTGEADRPKFWTRLLRNGGLGLLGSALGLLPLSTLPLGAGGVWRWGDVRSVDGFLHHVLRRDYGTLSLGLHQEVVSASDTIGRCLASLGEVLSAGLISPSASGWPAITSAALILGSLALAGWGLRTTLASDPESSEQIGQIRPGIAVGWIVTLASTAVGFPALQNIDPHDPFGAWILERFDLLPLLVWVPVVALAVATVVARSQDWLRSVRTGAIIRVGAWVIGAALLLAQLGAVLERGRPAQERAVEVAAIDLVEGPDPQGPAILTTEHPSTPIRAIVFGTDDHRSFPVLYVQTVRAAGQHTLYIDAQLLAHPWYRAQLRRRLPSLPDVDKPLRLIGAIWSDPTLDQVPIYFANVFSAPADRLPRIPEGLLWRIPPPPDHPRSHSEDWTLEAITARHLAALGRLQANPDDFSGRTHPRGHPWSADLWHAYREPSRVLAAMLAQDGRTDDLVALDEALRQRTGLGLADKPRP